MVLEFDRNGEVGGFVVVEIPSGYGVAAVKVDGVVDGICGTKLAGAIAVEELRVFRVSSASHIQISVEVEVGSDASFRSLAVVTRRYVDSGFAEGAVAFI